MSTGKLNGNADALSRIDYEGDKQQQDTQIENNDFVINAIHLKSETLNRQQLDDEDLKFIFALKLLERSGKQKEQITIFANENQRLLYKQWRKLFIINNNLYREQINNLTDDVVYQFVVPKHQIDFVMKMCHDTKTAGHLGYEKTRERITARFYWPNQLTDIENYLKSCDSCQRNKDPNHKNTAQLIPLRPSRPLELVTTDIMGPLPLTKNKHRYVLVVCDHFTKYVEIFALKTIVAEEVAEKLVQFCCRHSMPDAILSDQGTNYQSELLEELWNLLDIHKLRTTGIIRGSKANCF